MASETSEQPQPDRFTRKLLFPDKISDLLKEHESAVNLLLKQAKEQVEKSSKESVKQAATKAPLDEIFVLRFVLSNKTAEIALENIMKTLEWRSERLADLELAKSGIVKFNDITMKYSKVAVVGLLGGLHPTIVVRAGRSHTKGMFEKLDFDQLMENSILRTEHVYQLCGTFLLYLMVEKLFVV
jgi:hypothetical protein